jgi:putative oxidoreductase
MRKNLSMILVRVIVGVVFLTEGILKFLRPSELGVGRFAHIGLPYPHLLAPVVGAVEIAGGAALIFNFFAGDAALHLLMVILTAIFTTKVPVLTGHHLGPFGPPKLDRYGILTFIHEARTDLAMLFGLIAILLDSGMRISLRGRS